MSCSVISSIIEEQSMNIYVASSWKNARYPSIIRTLREAGHSQSVTFLQQNLLKRYDIELRHSFLHKIDVLQKKIMRLVL